MYYNVIKIVSKGIELETNLRRAQVELDAAREKELKQSRQKNKSRFNLRLFGYEKWKLIE